MSINIPAETPDESMNPISVEEFERLHPAMLGAIRKAVREEPARTVIGAIGDDRRSHLSSLDLRGIGIEVRRQLSARDMTTEVMGSILEHVNQAADRLSAEIQELRSELIREHVETVGGDAMEASIESNPLARRERPWHRALILSSGSDVSAAFPNTALAFAKSDPLLIFSPPFSAWVCSFSHSAGRPSNETRRESNQRSPTNESKGESEMSNDIKTWPATKTIVPVSVEEFKKRQPALLGAIREVVREELAAREESPVFDHPQDMLLGGSEDWHPRFKVTPRSVMAGSC